MVAFVGPSGAGKTTLIDMIFRFFDPWSGRILLDGVDIRDLKQKNLRKHLGMVPQDTALFNDTIMNNIRIGRPDATDEDVYSAARAAGAHLFIERKPDRYNTMVGERGQLLSGGERQRVAIARAMIMNPPIYVLDEASSALDAESEELVHKSMNDLRALNKTLFVIAHRLSTIRDADQIIVLRSGEIVEKGTHEELIKKGGLYHKLVTVQQLSANAEAIEAEVSKRPTAVKSGDTNAVSLPPPPPAGPTGLPPAPAAVALGPSPALIAASATVPAEPAPEVK
jgi:ABC-type multidrug transport system fused ATPase/permease subunit